MGLKIEKKSYSFETQKKLITEFARRVQSAPPYACPVEMALSFLKFCHSESCGKCTACRDGLADLIKLHEILLSGENKNDTILTEIKEIAEVISMSADCVIGKETAKFFLEIFNENQKDYKEHATKNTCVLPFEQPIPCVSLCPAHVDIPGYIMLVREKRFADAIKLIRKDNPFPTACGLICEHPCENRCRRKLMDESINIRGIKRYAVDMCHADKVDTPTKASSTGKKVCVIGGGPSGLTASYFLSLMGHDVTVYESKKKLGGMMRYGIPAYRFPRERLDEDIKVILSLGVKVETEKVIGKDVLLKDLKDRYDAIYIAIGAHIDKKIKLDGNDAKGVIAAVDMLREIGDEKYPDFTGKDVVVIGGGNVAMDCARTAKRCKAKSVRLVYRRKVEDMTALPEEIKSAMEEGVIIETLKAPFKILKDNDGNAIGFETEKQMPTLLDEKGRFGVKAIPGANHVTFKADIIIVAIGQDIDSRYFEGEGLATNKGAFLTNDFTQMDCDKKIFAGGDCVFGPATVIKAIQAGKVAAKEIDKFLGFNHEISCDVDIPVYKPHDEIRCGRVDMIEKDPIERAKSFEQSEILMSEEEMLQETNRCLRCDYKGCSLMRGGRELSW